MSTHANARENPARDDLAAVALASGATLEEASQVSGLSVSTISRRRHDPAFVQRMTELRDAAMTSAATALMNGALGAVSVLQELMLDPKAQGRVRVTAARSCLEMAERYHQVLFVDARLTELEEQIRIRDGDGQVVDDNTDDDNEDEE